MRTILGFLVLLSGLSADPAEGSDISEARQLAWLQQYLRIDTTTSDGTSDAARLLRDILHRQGVTTRLIVSPDGEQFVYARSGSDEAKAGALLLLHHIDVVPPGSSWTRQPFAAEVDDEILFGRGAVDDKSLGVAHLVSFLRVAAEPDLPAMDVIFLATSGEESGGTKGLAWLLDHYPELFTDVEAALTEGGTNRAYGKHLAWWGIEVAQKRPLWLQVTAHGRGGHGSSLNLYSAPHRLIRGLAKLVDRPRHYRLTDQAKLFLTAAAPYESLGFQKMVTALEEIVADPEPEKRLLPGMPNYLLDTIQVNILESGEQINITPTTAKARIDIRLLPDSDQDSLLDEFRTLLGDEIEVEVILSAPPVATSQLDTGLFQCLRKVLESKAPVIPAFITAVTDARFLRQRGIPVYGFSPFILNSDALRGIHGPDEQIPVEEFYRGVETTWKVVRQCSER